MFLDCGGRGVPRSSFPLACLAQELSPCRTRSLELVEESTEEGVSTVQIEDVAVRRTFRPPQYSTHAATWLEVGQLQGKGSAADGPGSGQASIASTTHDDRIDANCLGGPTTL